jgi:hypothetical protein
VQLTESRAERISPGAEIRLKIQRLLLKIKTLAWSDPGRKDREIVVLCVEKPKTVLSKRYSRKYKNIRKDLNIVIPQPLLSSQLRNF